MSTQDMSIAIHRYGHYSGVRFLRNRGVPFESAYQAVFGRPPRR